MWMKIEGAPKDRKIILAKFGWLRESFWVEKSDKGRFDFWWACAGQWCPCKNGWTDGIDKLAEPNYYMEIEMEFEGGMPVEK